MSFLEVNGVAKSFGAVVALNGIDLAVEQGSRMAIVGPSGSGKTTLLRIIAGFDAPDSGRVSLDGRLLADGPRILPTHERGIGVVAQDGALFPHLTVAENIGFGLKRGETGWQQRVRDMLAMVELDDSVLTRRPDQLSGGQQQRIALARALATRPQLMVLDEPFSALDTGLRANLRSAVAKLLQGAGITTILITHDQAEALSFADRVAVMRAGQLPQTGTPRDIYFRPTDRMIAEFMGDCLILKANVAGGEANCRLGIVPLVGTPRPGPCEIMLRPEQILLRPETDGPATPGELTARLLDIDFAGRTSAATIAIDDPMAATPDTMVLRGIGSRGLYPGARVVVSIRGTAHPLP
jgi:iron(III) transport system ATP-binding protein